MFTHFVKGRIATLCERAGPSQKAVELYEDTEAIKRVIIYGADKKHMMAPTHKA